MISTSRAHGIIDAALDYRAARQDLIAGNIANADTPHYRSRDIDFQKVLLQKRNEAFQKNDDQLQMAATHNAHIQNEESEALQRPTLFFRDGHGARNDGNSVDLDVETTELSKNQVMFNALISARKKSGGIFRAVLEASGKTS
jgi:flagellar basal-body rod protein FlgB